MPGKPRQRNLQHDFARPLRPALRLLGVFWALQLATDIDEHAGKLRPHGLKRARHSLLGGNDVIAEGGGVAGGRASRAVGRRQRRPVRRDARAELREPIIGAEPLARLILVIGDQRPAIPVLAALEPAKRAFRLVDKNRPPCAVDLLVLGGPELMLLAEGVARGGRPSEPRPARLGEQDLTTPALEPILRQTSLDQGSGNLALSFSRARSRSVAEDEGAARMAAKGAAVGKTPQQLPRLVLGLTFPSARSGVDRAHRHPWRKESASMSEDTARSR